MFDIIVLALCFTVLIVGSLTDLRTREVPDWVNYGLVFAGFGVRLIYSVFEWDLSFIIEGIIGFGIFYGLAMILFYTGQWGGGDSKMLMGLGAALGVPYYSWQSVISSDLVLFLGNLVIVGGLYGIFWSIILVLKNRRRFASRFKKIYASVRKIRLYVIATALALGVVALFLQDLRYQVLFALIAVSTVFIFYLWIAVRAIEKACMVKNIAVEKLTEGDWIVHDIVIDKKKVCSPKDLGITKEQIRKLMKYKQKGKIDKVLVKEGIPFVPSFLIAFLITVWTGSIIFDSLYLAFMV